MQELAERSLTDKRWSTSSISANSRSASLALLSRQKILPIFKARIGALTVMLLLLLSHSVQAQRERDTFTNVLNLEVSGHVRIADLNEPARNVTVRLERFSGGLVEQMNTDNQGRFRFTGLQRGYYTVVVEAPGFTAARQQADLQILFRAFLMFELTRDKPIPELSSLAVIDARVPEPARNEFAKARAALLEKKPKDAIPHLEKATFHYPEFFDAHLMLATSYMDLREWARAEAALRRALDIKPDHSAAVIWLGEVYWRQKRYDEAEKVLLNGLELNDKSWHGHFTLSRLYWDLGDLQKAGPALGRALQLKPDFAEAHLLAGNILLRLNQHERALEEYREYLRLAPKGEFAASAKELIEKLTKAVAENKKQ